MLEILLRNPIAVIIGALLIGLAGISGLRNLPMDLFPDLNYPLINIITHYPAGTAEDMEQLVTRPIENSIQGLNNLQRVSSTSAPGFSRVTVEFTWGVDVLIPASLGLGDGPQMLQPLGIMLFGGLTTGTLFTLNLLPTLYMATERWRKNG